MVESAVSKDLQIHGANSYQRKHPVEYRYRLARGRRLAAGTEEIQKNTIASLLKKDGRSSLT
ncbi:acyl-CoA dehydrogenase family protein [Natrialbaceae archaeon GCM10025810]|uniref:acyl-CoA dehydrogenase family protein n=1 Tax=Halovalidus salilacus TaxID=3075124 RepID=UPI00360BDE3B